MIKYIALAFGFLKGIMNAKFLGPDLLGLLGNLLLILSYCSYANLGIINSMNREYVLCKENNDKKSSDILNTVFSSLVLLSILFLFMSIAAICIYRDIYGVYLALIFIIAIFEQFKNYYTNYFRLMDNYKMINFIEIVYSIIAFLFTIFFISTYKVFAVLISMIICGAFILFSCYINTKSIRFSIDTKILKVLISVGVPLLIYNLGFYILTTIDRLIIIKYYSQSDLGYYTFANSMVSATLVFITSMLFLLYPKVIKAFNEEQSSNILERVKVYTRILEISSAIFFTIGILLFRPFILLFLGKYEQSIGIYMLLLMAVISNNLAYFSNCYIVSNKKQRYLIYLQGLAIIMNLTFNMIFMKMGLGVEGVALGTLLSNIIYSLVQYIIFIKLNSNSLKIAYVFKVYSRILCYSVFVVFMILLDMNYFVYSISAICITVILYIKEVPKIKYYLSVVKNN